MRVTVRVYDHSFVIPCGAGNQSVKWLSLVAGVLHLGNITFDGEDSAAVSPSSQDALDRARRMLGMEGLH